MRRRAMSVVWVCSLGMWLLVAPQARKQGLRQGFHLGEKGGGLSWGEDWMVGSSAEGANVRSTTPQSPSVEDNMRLKLNMTEVLQDFKIVDDMIANLSKEMSPDAFPEPSKPAKIVWKRDTIHRILADGRRFFLRRLNFTRYPPRLGFAVVEHTTRRKGRVQTRLLLRKRAPLHRHVSVTTLGDIRCLMRLGRLTGIPNRTEWRRVGEYVRFCVRNCSRTLQGIQLSARLSRVDLASLIIMAVESQNLAYSYPTESELIARQGIESLVRHVHILTNMVQGAEPVHAMPLAIEAMSLWVIQHFFNRQMNISFPDVRSEQLGNTSIKAAIRAMLQYHNKPQGVLELIRVHGPIVLSRQINALIPLYNAVIQVGVYPDECPCTLPDSFPHIGLDSSEDPEEIYKQPAPLIEFLDDELKARGDTDTDQSLQIKETEIMALSMATGSNMLAYGKILDDEPLVLSSLRSHASWIFSQALEQFKNTHTSSSISRQACLVETLCLCAIFQRSVGLVANFSEVSSLIPKFSRIIKQWRKAQVAGKYGGFPTCNRPDVQWYRSETIERVVNALLAFRAVDYLAHHKDVIPPGYENYHNHDNRHHHDNASNATHNALNPGGNDWMSRQVARSAECI